MSFTEKKIWRGFRLLAGGDAVPIALLIGFSTIRAAAQTPVVVPVHELALAAGQTVRLQLQPRQLQTLRIAVNADQYNELRVTLVDGGIKGTLVKIVPQGAAPADPVISDSGEPFVRLSVLPGQGTSATFQVTALTNSRTDTAPVDADVSLTVAGSSLEKVLYAKALAAFNHGEFLRRLHKGAAEALKSYQEAASDARQLHDAVLEQRALLSAGRMLMLTGKDYAKAVGLERQAVAVVGTDSAPGVQAMAWKMLGGALLNTVDYDESVRASQRALDIYRRTGDTFWQGVVLENIGSAYLNLGDLEKALATDEQALEISRRLHDDYGVVEMLAQVGSINESRGEYQAALNCFAEAVEVKLPSTYNPMQGEAWASLGHVHLALGEEAHAGEDFQRELEIAQHTASGLDELDALYNVGSVALLRGDVKGAHTVFARGLTRSRELELVRPRSALLIGLARAKVALAQPEEAKALLLEAVSLASGIHQRGQTAEAHSVLGEISQAEGHWKEAATEFAQAATLYAAIPDKAGLAQADASLARVEASDGRAPAAVDHLNQAMDIIESSRANFAKGNLRTRYFATQRGVYDAAITLLMQMDRARPGEGFAARAWTVAERARARSLLDEVSVSGASTVSSAAQTLLPQLAASGVNIRDLEAQLAQMGTSAVDVEASAHIETDLRNSLLAADELESRLSTSQAISFMDPKLISSERFGSSVLTTQDALIEYWVGTEATYVWAITHDGRCLGFQLGESKALPQMVSDYRAKLLARDQNLPGETIRAREMRIAHADQDVMRLAAQIGNLLLPSELELHLRDVGRLLIVADGPLTQIPFASLRPSQTTEGPKYIVQRFELLNEPSAAFLASQNESERVGRSQNIVVFADPVYNLADSRLHRPASAKPAVLQVTEHRSAMTDFSHLPRLPGSRNEAMAISTIAGPRRFELKLGFDATPDAVRATDWSKYTVAHFAAHAIAQPAGRNVSGILLSMFDQEGMRHDGVLWLRDIYAAHVAPDLVVLSGCGTALGETTPNEGVDSLLRAFLFSGAGQVGATLWSADDNSSQALMELFYRGLIDRGVGASQALREAQLALQSDPHYAAPYYWAGFVMEGRWKTH